MYEHDNIGREGAEDGEYDSLGAGEVGARRYRQVVEGGVEKVQLGNDLRIICCKVHVQLGLHRLRSLVYLSVAVQD